MILELQIALRSGALHFRLEPERALPAVLEELAPARYKSPCEQGCRTVILTVPVSEESVPSDAW